MTKQQVWRLALRKMTTEQRIGYMPMSEPRRRKPGPRPKGADAVTEPLTIAVTATLKEELERLAEHDGVSRSSLVRELIEAGLEVREGGITNPSRRQA